MKVLRGIGHLIVEFEDGKLAGQTYEMGGDNLVCEGYGFWVHTSTIRQMEPHETILTQRERNEVIEALKIAIKEHNEDFPLKKLEF